MNIKSLCLGTTNILCCIDQEMYISQIVKKSGYSWGQVSLQISLLEKIGVIKKETVTKYSYISLTKKGKKIQTHLNKIKELLNEER